MDKDLVRGREERFSFYSLQFFGEQKVREEVKLKDASGWLGRTELCLLQSIDKKIQNYTQNYTHPLLKLSP